MSTEDELSAIVEALADQVATWSDIVRVQSVYRWGELNFVMKTGAYIQVKPEIEGVWLARAYPSKAWADSRTACPYLIGNIGDVESTDVLALGLAEDLRSWIEAIPEPPASVWTRTIDDEFAWEELVSTLNRSSLGSKSTPQQDLSYIRGIVAQTGRPILDR